MSSSAEASWDLERFDPDDLAGVDELVDLTARSLAVEAPWEPPPTPTRMQILLRSGWDGEAPEFHVVRRDGAIVGGAMMWMSDYDNRDLVALEVLVAPEYRHTALGASMLRQVSALAGDRGRTKLLIGGWDTPWLRNLATTNGFALASVEVQRRQVWADLNWEEVNAHRDLALRSAEGYELTRLAGPSPAELLPSLAELTAAINDAPLDDLDVEDEAYPIERVAGYEQLAATWGRLRRVVAKHRETGELAGHTVVVVERERPWLGFQDDTAVARGHRGHRLGVLLKAELMVWLREEEPDLATVDTWNAKSNQHMIEVNQLLGYRPTGEAVTFQRNLG